MSANPQPLDRYRKTLTRHPDPFTCPDCQERLSPTAYEKHCAQRHAFNPKLGCVWCKNKFWVRGTKSKQADHLLTCALQQLRAPLPPPPRTPSPSPPAAVPLQLCNTHHRYPRHDAFGIAHALPDRAHEIPRPLLVPDTRYLRFYADDALHLASVYVRIYLETRDTTEWWHVMVKVVTYDSFLAALDAHTYCLEFSTWCDGGNARDAPQHRQHRHLIVVCTLPGHFKNVVWPRVKLARAEKPRPHFSCKLKKTIVSARHLVNTLGYLAHRKSRCEFSFKTLPRKQRAPLQNRHFFLHQTLPADFRLPLILFWNDGIRKLLYQAQLQHASALDLLQHPCEYVHGKWRQRLTHVQGLRRGRVLPVLNTLAPTSHVTPYGLFLVDGRKLYFEHRPELARLSPDAWLATQAEGGNRFYDVVQDAFWEPRPQLQKHIHQLKPILDRNKQLEADMATLKRTLQSLTDEKDQAKTDKDRLLREMYAEHKRLQRQLDRLTNVEVVRLHAVIQNLRYKLAQANRIDSPP